MHRNVSNRRRRAIGFAFPMDFVEVPWFRTLETTQRKQRVGRQSRPFQDRLMTGSEIQIATPGERQTRVSSFRTCLGGEFGDIHFG